MCPQILGCLLIFGAVKASGYSHQVNNDSSSESTSRSTLWRRSAENIKSVRMFARYVMTMLTFISAPNSLVYRHHTTSVTTDYKCYQQKFKRKWVRVSARVWNHKCVLWSAGWIPSLFIIFAGLMVAAKRAFTASHYGMSVGRLSNRFTVKWLRG